MNSRGITLVARGEDVKTRVHRCCDQTRSNKMSRDACKWSNEYLFPFRIVGNNQIYIRGRIVGNNQIDIRGNIKEYY